MKENKIALKRALAEYKGKQDYERLLKRFLQLEEVCDSAIKTGNRLADRLERSYEQNDNLKFALVILGGLLMAALVGCACLWKLAY